MARAARERRRRFSQSTQTRRIAVDQQINGRRVRFATGGRSIDGDEPAAVLIHGAGCDRTVWQLQTRWMAHRGYRAAAVDLPGHGGSEGPALTGIAEMGAWLAETVDCLGLAPAHLLGHSMGSFVALEAAAQHPEVAASLTLLGVAAAMPVHGALLSAAAEGDPLAGRLITSWGVGSRARTGGHASPGMWLIGANMALLERSAAGVLAADLAACDAYDSAETAAARVRCPVTLVLGVEDRMTPERAARPLLEAFGEGLANAVRLDRTGHFMQLENTAAVREAISAALASS